MAGSALLVGSAWIATSAVFSTYANGIFLRTFRDPYAHTFLRFAFSSALSLAYTAVADRPLLARLPQLSRRLLVPSVLLLLANVLNSLGMQHAGVTVTYVVKSLIPFFTVFVCRLRGERFDTAAYASLVPICAGVCLASLTDLDFNAVGFLCALASSLSQTLLNIVSKERIQECSLSGMQGFFVMATVCTILSAPMLLISYAQANGVMCILDIGHCSDLRFYSDRRLLLWIVLMGVAAYHIEYTLNFLYIKLCSPLAFSVTDILRRLGTIVCGTVIFSKPLSLLNVAGVLVALTGVFSYSAASTNARAKCARPPASPAEAATRSMMWTAEYSALKGIFDRRKKPSARSHKHQTASMCFVA